MYDTLNCYNAPTQPALDTPRCYAERCSNRTHAATVVNPTIVITDPLSVVFLDATVTHTADKPFVHAGDVAEVIIPAKPLRYGGQQITFIKFAGKRGFINGVK